MTERLIYTPTEAASLLGISKPTLYRAVKRGDIPYDRINGRIVFPAAALRARFGDAVQVEEGE